MSEWLTITKHTTLIGGVWGRIQLYVDELLGVVTVLDVAHTCDTCVRGSAPCSANTPFSRYTKALPGTPDNGLVALPASWGFGSVRLITLSLTMQGTSCSSSKQVTVKCGAERTFPNSVKRISL